MQVLVRGQGRIGVERDCTGAWEESLDRRNGDSDVERDCAGACGERLKRRLAGADGEVCVIGDGCSPLGVTAPGPEAKVLGWLV